MNEARANSKLVGVCNLFDQLLLRFALQQCFLTREVYVVSYLSVDSGGAMAFALIGASCTVVFLS